MAQTRFFNWKDDDLTDKLNHHNMGILDFGVYRGFVADLTVAGWNLNLKHTTNGASFVDAALALKQNIGVLVTKQGVVVKEDATIVLAIDPPTANPRYDLIVAEHQYVQTVGGNTCLYKVIKGVEAASPVVPALTVPNKQVLIGTLFVGDAATGLEDTSGEIVWTPEPVPGFANDPSIMRLQLVQIVPGLKTFQITKGMWKPASVNVGIHELTCSVNSNFYTLANQTDNYETIKNVNPSFGTADTATVITFITQQRLRIIAAPTSGSKIYTPEGLDLYIEAGETFSLVETTNLFGDATKNWHVYKANEALKGGINKFTALQMWHQAFTTSSASHVTGELTLPADGNFHKIQPDSGTGILKFIKSFDKLPIAGGTYEARKGQGTIVILMNVGTPIEVFDSSVVGAPPAGFKALTPPQHVAWANTLLKTGSISIWLETDSTWMMLTYFDQDNNWQAFSQLSLKELTDVDDALAPFGTNLLVYTNLTSQWESVLADVFINNYVQNYIHTYTKMQAWGGDAATYDGANKRIVITDAGNYFELPVASVNLEIEQIFMTGAISAINYSWIAIKFTGANPNSVKFNFNIGGGPFKILESYAGAPGSRSDVKLNTTYIFIKSSSGWMMVSAYGWLQQQLDGEPWHYVGQAGEPAFLNGWVNSYAGSSRDLRFKKIGKLVQVSGTIYNPGAVSVPVFQLPVEYRSSSAVTSGIAHENGAVTNLFPLYFDGAGNFNVAGVGGVTNKSLNLTMLFFVD